MNDIAERKRLAKLFSNQLACSCGTRSGLSLLVLQAILAGTTGVNFRQNGGEDVDKGTRLDGVDADLETFFPTVDPYLSPSLVMLILLSIAMRLKEDRIESS